METIIETIVINYFWGKRKNNNLTIFLTGKDEMKMKLLAILVGQPE